MSKKQMKKAIDKSLKSNAMGWFKPNKNKIKAKPKKKI